MQERYRVSAPEAPAASTELPTSPPSDVRRLRCWTPPGVTVTPLPVA
jgi:hypothetical protein